MCLLVVLAGNALLVCTFLLVVFYLTEGGEVSNLARL